jgi:hypothetical protein
MLVAGSHQKNSNGMGSEACRFGVFGIGTFILRSKTCEQYV